MKLTNTEKWEHLVELNSKEDDVWGKTIIDHIKTWAEIMERELKEGKDFKMIKTWEHIELFNEVMAGQYNPQFCAYMVMALSGCWVHGDKLVEWFNTQFGCKEKEGVINPLWFERVVTCEIPKRLILNNTKFIPAKVVIDYDIIDEKDEPRILEFGNDMCIDYIYVSQQGGKWVLNCSYAGQEVTVYKFSYWTTYDGKKIVVDV